MPNQTNNKRVCLGVIATAHGVKGLVRIKCEADDPHMLDGPLYTTESGAETVTLTLKNSLGSGGGKYWLAAVDGVTDRDAALALRGTRLWIDRAALPALEDENEFYIEDLIGLKAVNEQNGDEGTVIAVENFGAGDLLEIRPPQGDSYYLPFTKENVPGIDITAAQITIVPPETG